MSPQETHKIGNLEKLVRFPKDLIIYLKTFFQFLVPKNTGEASTSTYEETSGSNTHPSTAYTRGRFRRFL